MSISSPGYVIGVHLRSISGSRPSNVAPPARNTAKAGRQAAVLPSSILTSAHRRLKHVPAVNFEAAPSRNVDRTAAAWVTTGKSRFGAVLDRESLLEISLYEENTPFSGDVPRLKIPHACNSSYLVFMDIIPITTVIASLFLVVGAAQPFAARLRLSYTVILGRAGYDDRRRSNLLFAHGTDRRTDPGGRSNPAASASIHRLRFEGASLLNNAAAIALFGLFMGFVMLRMPDPDLGEELAPFPVLIFGALAG